ncbi:MAG: hypothetical protein K0S20_755, partial [Patescibacteria group bacterium]|nr:hypothetical protein [Patescibacteria group bacterium]
SLLSCALREIKEETGIEADVVSYIGIRQAEWAGTQGFLIDKTVHYFLCKYLSDETGMDQEHDGLEWLLFADAHTNLATNEKAEHLILERAHKEVSLLTE